MAHSNYKKSENRILRLKIHGATENLPLLIQAYGPDCRGTKERGDGAYAFVSAPQKGKSLFVHEVPSADKGTTFYLWKNSGTKDAPPALSLIDMAQNKVSAKAASRAIVAIAKAGSKPVRQSVAKSVLRGRWSGYLECTPGGPRVVMTRDIAQYTTLAIVGDPKNKAWEYAIHIKDLKSTNWFVGAAAKRKGSKVQSKNLTDKNYGTLQRCFNAAIKDLFGIVADACSVRDTVRSAAVSKTARAKSNARSRARGKSGTAPMTRTEVKSHVKSRGTAAAKKSSVVKKAAAAAKKSSVVKKAVMRKSAAKAQTALKGKFVTFNGHAGARKGVTAYVKDVSSNARGSYDPRQGGAALTILVPSSTGVREVKVNEYRIPKGKKTPVRILGVGGKGKFKTTLFGGLRTTVTRKVAGKDKKVAAWSNQHLIKVADALNENKALGTHKIVLGTNAKKALAKARAKAAAPKRKPAAKAAAPKRKPAAKAAAKKPAAKKPAVSRRVPRRKAAAKDVDKLLGKLGKSDDFNVDLGF